MSNYNTINLAKSNTNWETGEVTYSDIPNRKKSYYKGPKLYWRTMQLYDKATLLLHGTVGLQLLIYIKGEVNLDNYRIRLNATWLAEDIGSNPDTVSRNIKKLVDGKYIVKEKRGKYFVNPDMFWVEKMHPDKWQTLKQEYQELI